MRKLLTILTVAALGLGVSAPTATSAVGTTGTYRRAAQTYEDGYNQGFRETQQNKCIDGTRFESYYSNYYHPQAERNYQNSGGSGQEDYYRGYLDGMEEGYLNPAYCQ
ncbi:hypothetical protein GCM10027422_28910 [Hymenobacter arcticus]